MKVSSERFFCQNSVIPYSAGLSDGLQLFRK